MENEKRKGRENKSLIWEAKCRFLQEQIKYLTIHLENEYVIAVDDEEGNNFLLGREQEPSKENSNEEFELKTFRMNFKFDLISARCLCFTIIYDAGLKGIYYKIIKIKILQPSSLSKKIKEGK